MTTSSSRAEVFRALHASGCFVIPNPWDVGNAKVLASLGFPALATTSSGFASSLGRPDNSVTLDESLAHVRAIATSVDVPVNADFEGGFAVAPEKPSRRTWRQMLGCETGPSERPLFPATAPRAAAFGSGLRTEPRNELLDLALRLVARRAEHLAVILGGQMRPQQ